MPHIYIYTYICVYYTYIYTHHTAVYYLCMYSASLSCQQPRSRPRYLCMYYAPFLLDMGVKMGYFSLKFRHFRREASAFRGFPYFSDTTSSLLVWSRCLVCVCAPRSLEPILWHFFKSVSPAHSAAHSGSFYMTKVFFIRETVHAPNGRKSSRAFPDQRSLGL